MRLPVVGIRALMNHFFSPIHLRWAYYHIFECVEEEGGKFFS